MVFVPSYLDYVRIRNHCAASDRSFVGVSEYSSGPEMARARSQFFAGNRRLMVYTERAHFYNRFRMRGVRELVFYGLPAYAHFYVEMVNSLEGDGGALFRSGIALPAMGDRNDDAIVAIVSVTVGY